MARIAMILGSTREGRFSEHVAEWVRDRTASITALELDTVDLRDFPMPFFEGAPPAFAQRAYPTDSVARFGAAIDAAAGYLVLAPEYNHGYSAVLKNAMDSTFVEWRRKPIAFVGWGNAGAARAIEQLREVAVEFEMAPLRHAVHIMPETFRAIRASGDTSPAAFAAHDERLQLAIADLLWWSAALSAARAADA